MSTNSTQTRMSFRGAAAADLPKLICVGRVSDVKDGFVSESGKYVVQPIMIDAFGGGRSIKINFLYRPEWLRPGFDPASILESMDDADEAKKVHSVYRMHIEGPERSVSTLRGIAGSEEGFGVLSDALLSLPEVTLEAVTTVIRDYVENNPVQIGYELKQKTAKTGETDEAGKAIYRKENGYDIDTYWEVTDKNIKAKQKVAGKADGRIKMCFDPDTDLF